MRTTMPSRGRVVLPAKLREQDTIEAGQEFDVERIAPGEYRFVRRQRANDGLVDWLLACLEKGFFAPIQSESTCTRR
jgi:bifunctional DNA-binding transcriptional regulator/antitoxin component of YhaV-PrlF toxin-antitoxin module